MAGGSGGPEEHSPNAPGPDEAPARYEEHGWQTGATSDVPGEERQIWPDITKKEALTLLPLVALTIYIGVYPQAVLDVCEPALQRILAMVTP